MRDIYKDEELVVPEGVKVHIKAREVTVEGPRGKLTKHCKHVDMDIRVVKTGKGLRVKFVVWHGGRKHIACIRTIKSMIENMIIGVTKGFLYKMRSVYAHFPINVIMGENGQSVEIRNFLGEKLARQVPMLEGVEVMESKAQKDQIIIQGNDIEAVSQSAADIHTACLVKNKDIRKFLDGIYVEEKTNIEVAE